MKSSLLGRIILLSFCMSVQAEVKDVEMASVSYTLPTKLVKITSLNSISATVNFRSCENCSLHSYKTTPLTKTFIDDQHTDISTLKQQLFSRKFHTVRLGVDRKEGLLTFINLSNNTGEEVEHKNGWTLRGQ